MHDRIGKRKILLLLLIIASNFVRALIIYKTYEYMYDKANLTAKYFHVRSRMSTINDRSIRYMISLYVGEQSRTTTTNA